LTGIFVPGFTEEDKELTMDKMLQLTAVIEREEDGYVAKCPGAGA
jgi:hypothetical protein